jgi:ribosomal protein L6P/L9E
MNTNLIFLPNKLKFQILVLNYKKYLFVKVNNEVAYYYLLPYLINFKHNCLEILEKNSSNIISFKLNLINWLKTIENKYLKKLVLRGLGLKVSLHNNKILELKLGYSKPILISIPSNIEIFIFKKRILIEGFSAIEVNNFGYKLKSLKKPGVYKFKGLSYHSDKIKLKAVKK